MKANDLGWITTADASRMLGISVRTLYRFIDEGLVPAYRFGRVIRMQKVQVLAFIESCRVMPGDLEHLYPDRVGASPANGHDPAMEDL